MDQKTTHVQPQGVNASKLVEFGSALKKLGVRTNNLSVARHGWTVTELKRKPSHPFGWCKVP